MFLLLSYKCSFVLYIIQGQKSTVFYKNNFEKAAAPKADRWQKTTLNQRNRRF